MTLTSYVFEVQRFKVIKSRHKHLFTSLLTTSDLCSLLSDPAADLV